VTEKTITIFRNKEPKKPKIWTFGFFRFFLKNLKNLGFLKATSTALVLEHFGHKNQHRYEPRF